MKPFDRFCQSCGLLMRHASRFGRESDGTPNREYCSHCYRDGAFTQDVTMEEMIERCAAYFEDPDVEMTPEEARRIMRETFPFLKRWQEKDALAS